MLSGEGNSPLTIFRSYMKKSNLVSLILISSLVPIITSCEPSNEDVKHCVDENDVVVPEEECAKQEQINVERTNDAGVQYDDAGVAITPAVANHSRFRWYYGGLTVHPRGTKISGGSHTPIIGKSYSSPSTISRGGFGSSFRGGGS